MNLRRSREARDSLRNIRIREAARLINNNKDTGHGESHLSISRQQQIDEPILISDDSDNDSDVQVIHFKNVFMFYLESNLVIQF